MIREYELVFFRTKDEREPVLDFLRSLDRKTKAKASRDLQILGENGPRVRFPLSRPMGNGLFELRINVSGDATRIFYFFYKGKRIVLTNGFIKKTNKTPHREIEVALSRKREWEEQHDDVR